MQHGLDGSANGQLSASNAPGPPSAAACEDSQVNSTAPELADLTIAWFDMHARELPWRAAGTSPWAVLVSEMMLQQTPVERVRPTYSAWLARWPTPAALARDTPGDAVRMWGRLGYPRRALRLHECARRLVVRHGGAVPDDVDDLLRLPGVGDYTARAVAAFAFRQRQPVVDTNVRRLLARVVDGAGEAGPPATVRDRELAAAQLPSKPERAARASVGFMELGAVVCTARRPHCDICPLRAQCRWRAAGYPAYIGPRRTAQRFTGTDRQVRGLLLDLLRANDLPVNAERLDTVWPDRVQRARALDGLVADGLVAPVGPDSYSLPGS